MTKKGGNEEFMDKKTAKKLIDKTRDDYNLIAHHFASTRKYNWPDVKSAIDIILKNFDANKSIKVLDAGCGAGRVKELFSDYNVEYYGIDLSDELIKIAQDNYPKAHFLVGDITQLPFQNDFFDISVTIATIHHLPSQELRYKSIKEIYRVTKPGGWVLFDTWYFWTKPKFIKKIIGSFFTANELPFRDFYRPWKNSAGETKTNRYFHAWTKRELSKLIKISGFQNVSTVKNHYGLTAKSRNLEFIAQKLKSPKKRKA